MQCITVPYAVQYHIPYIMKGSAEHFSVVEWSAVLCSMIQRGAVRCSAVQYGAVQY